MKQLRWVLCLALAVNLAGCSGSGSTSDGAGASSVSVGTLPGGAQVVVSAASFSVDSAQGNKNVGTISIRGNASAGDYTLFLNETTTSGAPSDNTLVLNPDPCTIGSGGSCNIVYSKYNSLAVDHSVQIIATDNNGNSTALPIKIKMHVSATASASSTFKSAVTAMATANYDGFLSNGDTFAATNNGNIYVAQSSNTLSWVVELMPSPVNNGNYPVNAMVCDSNDILYIHTTEGIRGSSWKLGWATWQKLNMPANAYFYSMVADNSGNVYAGGWDGKQGAIFELVSGTTSWITLPNGNIPGYGPGAGSNRYNFVTAMTIDNTNNNIYVGTLGGNVYAYYLPGSTVGTPNTLYAIPTQPALVNGGKRVTALTMGAGSNTAVFAATIGGGLAQLICLPQNCAGSNQSNWATNSSKYKLQAPASTIWAMTYSKDYPGQTDCGTLHFITDGSQSEWSDQTCGIGAQFGGGTPVSANWDGNIIPQNTTSIYQMVMNANGAIYAGTSDGNVLMKRKTFNLIINTANSMYGTNLSTDILQIINCQQISPGNTLCPFIIPANLNDNEHNKITTIIEGVVEPTNNVLCHTSATLNALYHNALNVSLISNTRCTIKLEQNQFTAPNHGCVIDQNSGLTWSTELLYGTYSQVNDQINQINASGGMCGYSSGWRLPVDAEFFTLVPNYITPQGTMGFWRYSGFMFPNTNVINLWSSSNANDPGVQHDHDTFGVNYAGSNGFYPQFDVNPTYALMVHN